MSLRKIAGLLAAGGLTVGLIGGGVGAVFQDSVTATENINVGTFSCKIVAATPGAASDGIAADGKSLTFTAPTIMSSAPGSAPFTFTVENTGSIPDVLTVTTSPDPLSAPFSIIGAPFGSVPLATGATHTYSTGVSWTELGTGNLGQHGTVTWTVNCGEQAAAGGGTAIFDNHPATLPSNLPSFGVEAYYFNEWGAGVTFDGTARKASTATVTMSSWACETGSWTVPFGSPGACLTTTPGATYNVPITFNIYAVGTGNSVGALLATKTQTFAIPYRPSSISGGDGETWNGTSHGLATNITFTFAGETLNNTGIFGIAYNTSTNGYSPEGVGSHPEDSLNVATEPGTGVAAAPLFAGNWLPDSSHGYVANSSPASVFIGSGPATQFSAGDTFAGYLPAVQITATP